MRKRQPPTRPGVRGASWYLLLLFGTFVIGLFMSGRLYYDNQQKRIKQDQWQALSSIAELKVTQLVTWRQERLKDADFTLSNASFAELVAELQVQPTSRRLREEILSWVAPINKHHEYSRILLLGQGGRILLSLPGVHDTAGAVASEMLSESIRSKKALFSDFFEDPRGNLCLEIVVPILSRKLPGSPCVGSLVLSIDPHDYLYPVIQSWPIPSPTAEGMLVRYEGDDVVYLNPLRHTKNLPLQFRIPINQEYVAAAMAERGEEGVLEGLDYRKVPVLAVSRKVQDSPWFFIAKVDQEEVQAPIRRLAWFTAAMIALLVVATGLGIGLVWLNYTSSIERERYQVQLQRKALQVHFDYLARYANDIILLMDERGNIVEVNDRALSAYGHGRDELVLMNINQIRVSGSPGDSSGEVDLLRQRGGLVFESLHRRNDGSVFPVEESSRLVEIDGQDFRQNIVRDITERKQSEQMLRESERRFSEMLRSVKLIAVMLDAQGTVTFCNDFLLELTGWTRGEVVGKNWFTMFVPPEVRDNLHSVFQLTNPSSEFPPHYENEILTRQGERRVISWNNTTLRDLQGAVIGSTSLGEDITERKRAESALRESEEMFRLISESAEDLIAVIDLDGKRLYNSPSYREILGEPETIRGTDSFSEIHPDDRERIRQVFRETVRTGVGQRAEFRFLLKDGGVRYIESQGSVVRDANGNPVKVVIVSRNVTERTKAERQLRLLAQTIASARDCISITDLHDNILFVNEAFTNTYGYSDEELIGRNISIVRPVRDPDEATRAILPATIQGGWHGEIINRRKDGSDFSVELWTSPVKDDNGRIVAMVGVARDIADRKRVEEALRESEAKFRQLIEQAADGIFIADPEGAILLANSKSCEMLGYAKEELAGLNMQSTYATGEKDIAFYRTMRIGPGESLQFERNMRKKDGALIPVEVSLKMLADGSSLAIVRDVTQRKQSEEALKMSESRYRSLFENSLAGVYRVTLDGEILDCNDSFARILGYSSSQEVLRHKAYEFYFGEYGREEFLARLKKTGTLRANELCLKNQAGNGVYVLEDVNLVDGNILEGTIIDITERKRAEESERKLLRAVEQTDEVVFMTNPDGMITYVNPAFEKIYGYRKEDVVGKTPRLLKSGLVSSETYEKFWIDLLSGKSVRGEIINKSKDGRHLTIDFSVSPVFDEHGVISGFIAVHNDVTERRNVEEKKKNLEQQLFQVQKMESIGTLAGGIAHDFNNILTIITAYASTFNRVKNDPARLTQNIDAIRKAADRGASLVRQILTFARKTEVLFEPLEVNDVISELAKLLQQTFAKTIKIDLHLDKHVGLVSADRTQLHQALLNFCVNARDAMPDGGTLTISSGMVAAADVRLRSPKAQMKDHVCITVTDTGTGMDASTKDRIFEPFFTTKEKGKGTGLGLAVVYGIVQSHFGFIEVDTAPGCGTTFRMYLPDLGSDGAGQVSREEIKEESSGGRETILLVEDEEMLRELLTSLLKEKGYTVLEARDGEEALRTYAENLSRIALVMTDLGLPKLSGWQVFGRLKEINPKVKTIIASGYIEPVLKSEMLAAGVREILQKPYRPHEIFEKIRDVIDRNARVSDLMQHP